MKLLALFAPHLGPRCRSRHHGALSVVALVLALAACSSGPTTTAKPDATTADTWKAPDVAAPDPAPVAKAVGSEGGAVEHKSGAKLKIPAGALPADVELTVQALPPPAQVASAGTPLGAALQLGPEGQTFAALVQIAVPVDPAAVAGLDPAELQIVLAPSAGGEFVGLDTVYDAKNQLLLAETTHFSIAVPVKRKGPPLAMGVPTTPVAKVGEVFGPLDLKANGGKAPYAWSIAGGALPPGLALSPLGSVSGIPTQAGPFAASVRVKDTGGQLLEKAIAFTVDGPPNGKPVLTSLDPASAVAGGGDLVVAVNGSGLVQGALVTVDGKGVPTQFVDASQIKATVGAAKLTTEGTLQLAAVNPAPGGGASNALPLTVTAVPVGGDVVSSDIEDAGSSGDSEVVGNDTDDTGGDSADGSADATPVCQPKPEVCDGQDNDCNGQTDEGSCDDGDLCTTSDACVAAKCAGTAKDCADSDACTVDGCNAVDGKCENAAFEGCGLPCAATADCKDDANPCAVAACQAGKCAVLVGKAACSDGNPCTDDACDSKTGCGNPANSAPCSDGKVCVQGDACANKVCAPGKVSLCDDGNACTLDNCSEASGCSYQPTSGACDDGDGCTVGEACTDGSCKGAVAKNCDDGKPCTLDSCDPANGNCATAVIVGCGDACKVAGDCKDDGNPCTQATCVADACGVTPTTANCDDGDPCTSADACAAGACGGTVDACDDGNSCTADSCGKDGKCSSANQPGECNDGDACTIFDACAAGACKAGGAANCDDGNACTDDGCAAKLGCQHPDSKTPCSDSNPCTVGDACKDAACKPTGPKVCSDGDNCTLDSCDAVDGSCDVTVLEGCGGFCNTPKDCKDDGNPCTDWACPAGKCEVSYNGLSCDDNDACSQTDTCGDGKCAGKPLDCDDKNVCSDDSCDSAKGCVHLANAATCTDGAVCTVADSCKDQACKPGPEVDCDDHNACTFDTCIAGKGCVHTTGGQACSDGNPCTLGDACVGANCTAGSAKTCDDSNGCTADSCSPQTGACLYAKIAGCGAGCAADKDCVGGLGPCLPLACAGGVCAAKASTATCDDGSVCSSGDACADGQCQGKAADCNDGNGCTADGCDGKKGCQHAELIGACEDGDLCSVMDLCQAGVCKGGPGQQCSDGNPCTADGCDAKVGCQFANSAGACDDGNPCTKADACAKGACLPGDVSPCDDGKGCTADSCDAKNGQCAHADLAGCGAACQGDVDCKDDGNPCTVASCKEGVCALAATASPCDDANPCTHGDACKGTACQGSPTQCDDSNPCTDDGCDAKAGCSFAANKVACSTGNVCLSGESCNAKVCGGGQPTNCDDGNSCTLDQCMPKGGCQHTATNAPCDDGSPCSIEDECGDGACIGGTYLPCDDGDGCTADTCDSAKGGCVFTPLAGCGKLCGADKDCPADDSPCTEALCAAGVCVVAFVDQPCNDGDACSSGDLCSGGVCGGTENACDDGNACTTDTCLGGAKGCSHGLAKGPCDDGSACTSGDVCVVGLCKGQGVLACDDGNPCSADGCDPKLGCTHAAGKGGCDDGNPCTQGDGCANLTCQPGKVVACDDGKPCTFDACNPATGQCASADVAGCGGNCQANADCAATGLACAALTCDGGACKLALSATSCDDANACTGGDACAAGLCVGAPKSCNDDNSCTLDSCASKAGCQYAPLGGPCDDGNACTAGEACGQGSCGGGKAIACSDANPCTDDTCKPTLGCVQLANDVTCDDGNLCTTGDTCAGEFCMGDGDKDCSDGNPCTLDGCSTAKGCIHAPSEAACNDGDACTKGDVCLENQCTAGKPVNCDDGETCTDDACDKKTGCVYTPKPGTCSDGDPCTDGDVCLFGNCVAGQDKDCSDGNGCTADSCSVSLGCVHTDTTAACDDGDACTQGDVCAKGACAPGKAAACDDNNPCTDDSCDKATGCKHTANTAACSDGNACTGGDGCLQGVCTAGAAVDCDDKNLCTSEKCDPQKGCAILPLDITCTDDNACTTTDNCKGGDCVPGPKPDCDDGKVCTDDSCDKVKGCVSLANTATCTDGSVCTTDDGCKDGACLPGAPTSCDDKNPCTDDTCDKIKGCANVQSTKPCDDTDACTNKDTCANGKCVAVAVNCDDGNACTSETCDPVKGCANEPIDVVCSDGDACTAIDNCVGLQCVAGTTVQCDDKNVCTDDSCDKTKGCVNAANTKACNDGSVCTSNDGCAGGKCGGTAVNCNDNNACTDDSCDKVEGCVNLANTITCTDGDACTTGDACTGGACLTGKSANCDDGNACTDDSCDSVKGCQSANNTAQCSDNSVCTTGDVCTGGTCKGTAKNCDDSNACTDDSCDDAAGCKNTANGASTCNDGSACTTNDGCAQGKCDGTAVVCNDNVACTVDSCVPATGCKFAPNNNLCNDNETCTTESCDAVAGCKTTTASDNSGCTTSDPCVTNPVCLSGKCSQKPIVTTKDMNLHPTALMADGETVFVVTEGDQQGNYHFLRLDADLKTVYDVKYQGTGGHAERFSGDLWGGGFFDSGIIVASLTADGNPTHNRLRRLAPNGGAEQWSRVTPKPIARFRLDNGGMAGVPQTATHQTNEIFFFDTNGNVQYTHMLPGYGRDLVWDNQYDGSFVVCGHMLQSPGVNNNAKPWIAKIRRNGYLEIKWQKVFSSNFAESKAAYACSYDGGGGAYVYSNDGTGNDDSVITHYDKNGNLIWTKAKIAPDANAQTNGTLMVSGLGGSVLLGMQNGAWAMASVVTDGGALKWSKVLPNYDVGGNIKGAAVGSHLFVGGWYNNVGKGIPGKAFVLKVNADGTVGNPTCTATNLCTGKTCNDNVPCTLDTCDPKTGCVYTPDASQCDDGNLCTANTCDAVKGCTYPGSTAACDDKNPCTDDACDPIKSCTNTANAASCEDGNACTVGDTCGSKACLAGAAKNCEDGIACTSHGCDNKTGCKQTPNSSKCDDKKPCTADTCDVAKGCTYGPDTKLCDDANLCTDDLCDNAAGCSHVANAVLCNDGNACTTADACVGGACKGPKAVVCDDLKECTTDSCDPASGCKVANKSNSTSCTPSTSCSDVATCNGAGDCNDGPSKFWVKGLDVLKGGLSPNAMKLMPDGNGFVYIRNDHGGDSTATLRRADKYGNTVWEQTAFPARMQAVAVTSNNNTEMHFGGIRGNNANALYEIRDGNTGNLKGGWEFADSGYAYIMDIAYEGKTSNAFWAVYQAGSGANANIKLARLDTKEPKPFYSGSHEDQPAALVFDSDVPVVVGATKSLSGGTYQAYYQVGQFDSPHVVANGQFYDAILMNGVWAIGYGNDGGPNYMLLARITNGLLVKKITQVDWGESLASNGSAMWAVGAGGNIGKIVKLSMAGDVDWVNSYTIPNLNGRLVAIQAYSNQYLLAVGTSYNGANGQSILTGVKANQDGVANCTDKNQCASLAANACDDKIACTADACDFKEGCLHFASDLACNDGNPCTNNTCDAAKGCLFPPNNNVPCNDSNACTVDTCDSAAAKCIFKLDVAAACNDNNVCSIEYCTKATGCTYGSLSCEDNNPCTDESAGCDAKTGCSHVSLDNKPCDDGLFCTVEDFCVVGKCAGPNVCDLPANGNLVLHLDARVNKSLVMAGKKVATWHGVQAGQTQLTGAVVFGDFNTPEVVTQAINGKTAVDLTFANLNVTWPAKDEWTAMAVFKNDKNPSGVANLMSAGPWSVNIYGVDCTLSYNKGVVSGASSSTPTVPYGQPRIAVLRVTKAGAVMYVFGGVQAETGSIPMDYAILGSFNQIRLKTVTLGALQIYDKALSSAEMAVAVGDLKQDWGFVGKCKLDSDCNDADGCTKDTCDAVNGCQATPITTNGGNTSCDDGNACSQSKNCNNGVCVAATTKDCNDNNPCTADSCNPYNGKCVNVPAEGSPKCDDGNACTEEYCSSGECKKSNKLCDDNNLCTDDSCDPKAGCKTAHNAAACDDGNVCTSSDICTLGICKGLANTVPCNDFNPCTTADTCANGGCAGKDIVCPDKDENLCTVETCSVFTGCKVTGIKGCYDGKVCTNDYCDPKVGTCVYTNNQNPCSDNELCTVGDFCAGGKCNAGKLNDCDDVDICTTDKCVSNVGCSNAYSSKCEDGSLCTVDDLCAFGFCLGGAPPNCDDGNTCTNDFCDPAKGCGHSDVADGAACSDGVECTQPDQCAVGSCKPGPKVCDYAVTNTEDSGAGSLRTALVQAEIDQGKVSGGAKFPAVVTIRTFLGGKVMLQSPLPTIYYDKVLETNGETFIIDGATKYRPLFSTAQALTIKNIKFQNCAAKIAEDSKEGWGLDGNGACIAIRSGSGYWNWTILTLVDVSFYNGIAEKGGGALFASSPYGKEAIVKMTGGTVIKNMAQTATSEKSANGMTVWTDGGGGVRVVGTGASFTASNVRFDYNISAGLGGALWCGGGATCDVSQASFYGGIAQDGAVAVSANSKLTLTNVTITANEPGNLVSGLYSSGVTVLRHVTIDGNSALTGKNHTAAYFNGATTIVNSVLSESGGTAKELDCLVGPGATMAVSDSLITVSKDLAGWGPEGVAKKCTGAGGKSANLASAQLEGNLRVMWPNNGSPVIDKAGLAACLASPVNGIDALGAKRPKGNGCDQGAVEDLPLK